MRLMLGYLESPVLLVIVDSDFDVCNFKFYVINGDWYGTFKNGDIYNVLHPQSPSRTGFEILSKDQNLLAGNYNGVFVKFDNFKRSWNE